MGRNRLVLLTISLGEPLEQICASHPHKSEFCGIRGPDFQRKMLPQGTQREAHQTIISDGLQVMALRVPHSKRFVGKISSNHCGDVN